MANILIYASNLKAGGGLQVADSLCRNLHHFKQHHFTALIPDGISYLEKQLISDNIEVIKYTTYTSIYTAVSGRNRFLDNIVKKNEIDIVLIIFGPSTWRPKCPTVSGFAMPHLVLNDSPYWKVISKFQLIKSFCKNYIHRLNLSCLSDCFYTENPFITTKFKQIFPNKEVYTISNTCHQVFDNPEQWDKSISLPDYNGFTFLTVCANYPHKNINIIPKVLSSLRAKSPATKVRFVLTVDPKDVVIEDEWMREHIIFLGKIRVNQCPNLYKQVDAIFLPSLLECFSANYVEAMKMKKNILTSDLGFAHSLCGKSALYFNPLEPEDISSVIIRLVSDPTLRNNLIAYGTSQLLEFETSSSRAKKIIELLERKIEHNNKYINN